MLGRNGGTRAAVLAAMAAAVLVWAAPAHAWYVDLSITGAGNVWEFTDANELDEHCTAYPEEGFSSLSATPTDVLGAICRAGDGSGDYGHGWIVEYRAVPASGYRFAGWRASSGESETSVKCDGANGSSNWAGSNCRFQIFENLHTQARFVDDTSPSMASLNGPNAAVNGPATFTFSAASDPTFSHFQCRLVSVVSGSESQLHDFQTCTSGVQKDPAPSGTEGTYKLYVRAVDHSGNASAPSSFTWSADKLRPETTLDSGTGPNGTTSSTSATFAFSSSSDDVTGYTCRLDGANTSCASPKTYTGLADGTHTFEVSAIDDAGNQDATPASRMWTVDGTPPETSLTGGPASGSFTHDRTATFTFTSSEAASFECQIDFTGYGPCESPRAFTALTDGPHTFSVRARDAAGNADATPDTRTWTVDTVAPDTAIATGPEHGSSTRSRTVLFSFTSTEGGAFDCSLDGGAYTVCKSPKEYSDLAEGEHTLSVRARDAAGNEDATPATRTWTVDLAAPTATITGGPASGSSSTATSATFTFAADEVATFECRLGAAAFGPCSGTGSHAVSGLAPGTYAFEVRATDAAGNVGPAARRTFTVATPPVRGGSPGTGTPGPIVVTPKRMSAAARLKARVRRGRTTFKSFSLVELPPAATVKVTCKGKGCGFKRKTLKATRSTLSLTKLLKKRALKPGARVELRITAPGYAPAAFRYTTQKGSRAPKGGRLG